MKKYLYYPITTRFFSIARFLHNDVNFRNSYHCTFWGTGLVGKSFGEVYGYHFIDEQICDDSNLKNMVKNVEAIVLLPVEEFYNQNVVKNKIDILKKIAHEYKKKIFDYSKEDYIPFDICTNPKGRPVKNIQKAVISIGGLIDTSRSTEIFLSTLSILQQHNIKVSAFSSYLPTALLGVHYIGSMKSSASIGAEKYIKSLNSYIIQESVNDDSDVILVDIPSCFIAYNNLSTSDFGVLAFEMLQAVPTDCLIISIPLDCSDIDFKHSMNIFFQQRFGKEPSAIIVENSIINYLEVERGGGMTKLIVPPEKINKYMHTCINTNFLHIWDKDLDGQIYKRIAPILEELI